MRTIGVVTVGRSDFGIYRPILAAIRAAGDLQLKLFVGGAHLAPAPHGTVDEINAAGYAIARRVEAPSCGDAPLDVAHAIAGNVAGFAVALASDRPDLLVVLGDRYEMFAAAAAAVPLGIPLVHIHGGEVTHGAIDESFRHAITKFAHFHFAATDAAARRLRQLGEEPWRVVVSGAPSLDNLRCMSLPSWSELAADLRLPPDERPLLVTYHPETVRDETTLGCADELLAALNCFDVPIVITAPNADMRCRQVRMRMQEFAASRSQVRFCENLGSRRYFGLMRHAAAMIGNSSSGLIEAPSFELPVVNIGMRQGGREAAANVIHSGDGRAEIIAAIELAMSGEFRRGLVGLKNPYGDGYAADRIVSQLQVLSLSERLMLKRFCDLQFGDATGRLEAA